MEYTNYYDIMILYMLTNTLYKINKLFCRLFHLGAVSLVVLLLFLVAPAIILDLLEPVWSWFDSFYYCFISLTTVGLGDFIPGDEAGQVARSAYKTGVTVYLVLGLVAVMTIVSLVTSTPELDLTKWFRGQDSEVRVIKKYCVSYI